MKSMNTVKKLWKIISTKTCKKVMEDEKVTGKSRDAVHCSCDIILQLTKKVLAIFHNLKDYDRFDFLWILKIG